MDKQLATTIIRITVLLLLVGFVLIYRNLNSLSSFSEYEGLILALISFGIFFTVGCQNIKELNDMFEFGK